ncbi:MAG: hypothetical protein EOM26_12075 [Alphaproteobacteria bacterium]|nr:hypothetical protein [Alphaproteobacteria bacterium]
MLCLLWNQSVDRHRARCRCRGKLPGWRFPPCRTSEPWPKHQCKRSNSGITVSMESSRRMRQSVLLLALLLLFGQEGNGSWMDTTTIGDPGNPGDLYDIGNPAYPEDDVYLGGVDYVYQVGTYEVTVDQYTEFLNAKAQSDPYGLYRDSMGNPGGYGNPFILRSGSEGSYSYAAVAGKEDEPVRWISYFDALRFCNWLSNGRGAGDTETGSYTLSLGLSVTRELGATWVLPTEDEWYKAAYYDPDTGMYYD